MEKCRCESCREKAGYNPLNPDHWKTMFRYACGICGNKRCPHHQNHKYKCTNSNEPNQIGEQQ